MRLWRPIVFLAALALAIPAVAVSQQQLPIQLEMAVIGKMLSYDQNLATREKPAKLINIAVLYLPDNPKSKKHADTLLATINTLGNSRIVNGKSVNVHKIPYNSATHAQAAIAQKNASIAYICPEMESQISDIIKYSHSKKILTIGSKPSYVKNGVAFGVFLAGNKPKMVINLPASRAEGANFSTALLKLATVLH